MAGTSLPSNRRLILYFVLLGALLPEAITGSTPPLAWLNPVQALLNFWLYGTGVLLVRELSIRWRVGWPGILTLGAAYGIVEEGLAVTTFFNPTLPQVQDLWWYGRWAGTSFVWAQWLTIFHATVSIGFTIFLIEWHYPETRGRSLMPTWGVAATAVLLAAATLAINALVSLGSPYRPGAAEFLGALAAIAILVAIARRWAVPLWNRFPGRKLGSPRAYAVLGFVFLLASFLLYAGGPSLAGNAAVTMAEGAAVLLATLWLVRGIAGRPEMERERFAFVAGGVGMFAVFDVFLVLAGRPDMIIPGIAFLVYVLWLHREKGPESAPPAVRVVLG